MTTATEPATALPTIPVMKPWLGEEEAAAAAEAVTSGWVAQGPRVRAFEQEFAQRVGATEGVAVSNCTTGLHLALHLLGIGAGDEVVVRCAVPVPGEHVQEADADDQSHGGGRDFRQAAD